MSEKLRPLDISHRCPQCIQAAKHQKLCSEFIYHTAMRHMNDEFKKIPEEIPCSHGHIYSMFPIIQDGERKGFIVLLDIPKHLANKKQLMAAFAAFLSNMIRYAYKEFELQHVYETVHPRALALSTLHSLHRVIRSSLRLDELLPRVARLCAQILKARGSAIMLVDSTGKYLIPKVVLGDMAKTKKHIRHRLGHGIEGKVGETCEFYRSPRCIAIPLIDDDLVGVISVCNKIDNSPFTDADVEIVKTLSEQAVVAIKSAQLYEESEELTLGSIKSINELMNLSLDVDHSHHQILGDLAIEIGKEMHIHGDELTNLYRATYLLDTGQIGTPKNILEKRSKLTLEEFEKVKQHPESGANVLRKIPSLRPLIPIILHHHERYDGKGYPDHLKAKDIPLGARIVAIVDAYSAMISKRPYRKKMAPEEAVEEIRKNSGTQFDPDVVAVFERVMERRLRENRTA
ncbi:MAG: HD domain-containing protein [Candidatus Omnitrophica bacterium]|nr:HD domain-containing protein [Candidatus Omnitrophota bacterium]